MNKRFDSRSIKGKLISVIMASSACILILATGGFIAYEYFTFQDSISHALLTNAAIVADSSTAALTFGDVRTATEVLAVLKREPHIVTAAIFGKDGKRFASYQRDGVESSPPEASDRQGVVAVRGGLSG